MKKNIKSDILKKIDSKEVKMRPRWWFTAKKGGMRGVYITMILLAVAGVMALIDWNELSELGYDIIAEDFPIQRTIGLLIGLVTSAIVMSKIGDNYKKNILFWVMATIMAVTVIVFLLKIFL